MIREAIARLVKREDLSMEEAEAAMGAIMAGEATPAQIGAFLIALRMKGETIPEIVGCARAMRRAMQRVPYDGLAVDTCGTGGDGARTFNLSTAAAFVVAGAGVPVAKHGNRAVSSPSGSADLLAALGAELTLTPEQAARALQEIGFAFLFAPAFHPAMRHAIGPRREIGVRTIFNILGPLCNPAEVPYQVTGVFNPDLVEPLAEVLGALGSRHAFVICGVGNVDEVTPVGPTRVAEYVEGRVRTWIFDPADYGIPRAPMDALRGATPEENAQRLRALFQGQENGPLRTAVLLNAAFALRAADQVEDLREGLARAEQALTSGAALAVLESYVAYTRSLAQGN